MSGCKHIVGLLISAALGFLVGRIALKAVGNALLGGRFFK